MLILIAALESFRNIDNAEEKKRADVEGREGGAVQTFGLRTTSASAATDQAKSCLLPLFLDEGGKGANYFFGCVDQELHYLSASYADL